MPWSRHICPVTKIRTKRIKNWFRHFLFSINTDFDKGRLLWSIEIVRWLFVWRKCECHRAYRNFNYASLIMSEPIKFTMKAKKPVLGFLSVFSRSGLFVIPFSIDFSSLNQTISEHPKLLTKNMKLVATWDFLSTT